MEIIYAVFAHCKETLAVSRTFQTKLKGIAQPVMLYVVEDMIQTQ